MLKIEYWGTLILLLTSIVIFGQNTETKIFFNSNSQISKISIKCIEKIDLTSLYLDDQQYWTRNSDSVPDQIGYASWYYNTESNLLIIQLKSVDCDKVEIRSPFRNDKKIIEWIGINNVENKISFQITD